MSSVSTETAIGQLLAVLLEAFEGPPGKGSYFVDNDPDAGFFGTLKKVSAAEASRPIGGSTIAAHVFHMNFSLDASTGWIRGDRHARNWNDSWRTRSADEAEWSRMREELRTRYADLRQAIESDALRDEDAIGGAIGVLAHAAYHLGAIRQKIVCGR